MKKRTKITQKEIASRAGVSQTVVSLVLNNSYDVALSEETRRRVMEVAQELGYVPQAAAKSLAEGHSRYIGLILVQPHYQVFRDPYIPNIITGLSEELREQGYRLIVEHISALDDLTTIRNMLKGGEVAGALLSNFHWAEEVAAPLIEEDYPIVLLDDIAREGYHSVAIDHNAGVQLAAEHLASLGYQRISCITYGPMAHPHVTKRLNIFTDSLAQMGIHLDMGYVYEGHYDPDSGYEAMRELLAKKPLPEAVFGMNDMMALGAMRAIIDSGLRIPQDIAVMGYDDMRFAAFANPALTTIRAPEIEQGRVAADMLIKLIQGENVPQKRVRLSTQLVVRDSCGGSN